MKITCQACAAKYTIADEKVLGKIVKIKCKKCGATIVVNGNDPAAAAGPASQAPRAFDYAGQDSQGEPWTVNVADGDQRTMADGEIVEAFRAGVVTEETFCWKDGMTDWLPLREIEDLYTACTATRVGAPVPEPEEGVTKVQETSPAMFAAMSAATPAYAPPAYTAPAYAAPAAPAQAAANGGALLTAPAARRVGGRAPAVDLFSGAAQAGGEDDVMTSAPTGMPQAHEDASALTGARNENSVLFSLNALTSKGPGGSRPPMTASSEASGLIDIRQLGAQIGIGDDKKQRRLDDIMNLAGGGAFSPSLGAPVLAPPPIEEYAPRPEGAGATGALPVAPKSRGLIYLAIGGGALVVALAIGAAVMLMGKPDADKTGATASASAGSTDSVPSASAAMTAPTTPTATGTDTAAAPTTPGAATTTAATTAATTSKTAATATTKPTATTAATTAATTEAPTATAAAPTAKATAAAAAGGSEPFNMGEAKARLAAIAGSVQGCKKGDASGSGRVVVTFAPSGGVQSAAVSGTGFEGTPTGACVASRFRGARVPPFSGSPFSVSKSFNIN